MKCYLLALIIIIELFGSKLYLIECDSVDGIVSVNTKNGVVNGQKFDNQVNEFLGIPYAEPPIGDLRFKKPVAVSNWTHPINATQLPNPCYQIPFTDTFLNTNFSEDCLYLNIWQPFSDFDSNSLKAVMFFIHGGGQLAGSSSEYQFQGRILSTKGDVVLVTHNYRVNSLGFLYAGNDDAPGNVGLWDNVLALKWVRNNIRYFGGDPNRITLFGQSGGSWALSVHILSPISRNLFRSAILMSGALITSEVATKTIAKQQWLAGAKVIGCANSTDSSFNTRIINCLRNASASDLVSIPYLPEIVGNVISIPPMVVVDGVLLPICTVEMLESGNYKKDLNLMFGTVEDEGHIFTAAFVPGYGVTSPGNYTYAQSYANLTNLAQRLPSYTPIDGKQVAKLYYSEISPQTTDYDLLRLTTTISIGDFIIGCQTKVFAENVFKYDRQNCKVYEYFYTSKLGTSVYFCVLWMGTCHGADLSPLFGLPFIYHNNYTDAQRNESVRVIEVFSHFVKYGYPSPQNGIAWPQYYSLNNNTVTPYLNIDTNSWNFSYGLKLTECQYLWKKYFYVKLPNC